MSASAKVIPIRPERSELPAHVTVEDVQQSLRCARSTAYKHLAQAAGRRPGARGLLRVPVEEWLRYAATIPGGSTTQNAAPSNPAPAPAPAPAPPRLTAGPPQLRLVASNPTPVRATQPRRPKR